MSAPGDPPAGRAPDDGVPAEVTDLDPAASGLDEGPSAEEAPSAAEEVFVDGTVGRSDLAAERDDYLEALQRVKAEFDNYRKRVDRERLQMVDRAGEKLVTELLPVLDACDAAVAQGDEGVRQIRAKLLEVLGKEGLEPMESEGKPFDPNLHEAVLREEGDGVGDVVVVEIMRSGYTWRGRVLRPAMVKVRS